MLFRSWQSVETSRRPDRPGVGYLLRHGTTERVLLSGSGGQERGDPRNGGGETGAATTVLALARFGGQPAVVLGQQRVTGHLVGPAALREARRGMAPAGRSSSTPGRRPSARASSRRRPVDLSGVARAARE